MLEGPTRPVNPHHAAGPHDRCAGIGRGPPCRAMRPRHAFAAAAAFLGTLSFIAAPCLAENEPPPPGPLAPDVILALAERDGLIAVGDPELHRLGARWLTSQRSAELDGRPPREVIVEVTEYTGEGTWQTEYRAYRPGEPLPTPIAPPVITGGYREPGYLALHDLDGDGRQALVVVGDTAGDSPSTLDVWRLDGGRWQQVAWGPDAGLDYVVIDGASSAELPLPGGAPIVALRPDEGRALAEPWLEIDGRYRPWPVESTPWLVPLLRHVAVDPPERPSLVLPGLGASVRAAKLDPGAAALRDLRRLHDQLDATDDHAAVLDAMSWPGNVAAAPHLRRFLDPPTAPTLQAAAAEGLVRVGADADRDALLERLDADVGSTLGQALVRGFAERGDPRARARLAALARDGRLSTEARGEIVRLLAVDAAAVPELLRALDAPRAPRRAIVGALWNRALFDEAHPVWRLAAVVEGARALLADPDPEIARDAVLLVRVADPQAAETLQRAASAAGPAAATPIMRALVELQAADTVGAERARIAADGLRTGQAVDAATQARWHRAVARYGDDDARAAGLAALDPRRPDAASLLDAYAQGIAARAPRAADAIDGISLQLLRFTDAEMPDRVRQSAVRALGPIDHERVRVGLGLALRLDTVFYVRAGAAGALWRRHPDSEAMLIVQLASEPEEHVRGAIIEALGKQGTPRARAALIDRLGHPRDGWAAAHALARVPDAAGLEVGAVLAGRATEAAGRGDCERARTLVGALARGGLSEADGALQDAIAGCPADESSLVTSAIDAWHREGSLDSRRRVLAFADADARAIGRAAWHALTHWPEASSR